MPEFVMNRRQFARSFATLACAAAAPRLLGALDDMRPPIRVAVSMETLAGANVNDARAAYRAWSAEIGRTLVGRRVQIVQDVFIPSEQLIAMIRSGQIDGFALTALEYAHVIDVVDPAIMEVEGRDANGLEMLLLVHRDSPYQKIEDLAGAKIYFQHHRDTSLVQPWLSIELANRNLPPIDRFFGVAQTREKIADVVLPLFFKGVQAAAICQLEFATAVELNPQLGRSLRPLLVSPRIIPVGFWFRKSAPAGDIRDFQQSLSKLKDNAAGKQALALYQSQGFTPHPCSVMNPTLEMVRQYERIRRKQGAKA